MSRVHPNLVGWWMMDGNLSDWSGNGNDASVFSGTHGYAPGVFGRARDYGSGGDLVLQGKEFYGSNNAFSFSFWAKTDSETNNIIPIGAVNDGSTTAAHIMFNRNAAGAIRFYIRKSTAETQQILISGGHPSSEWFHVGATYSDSPGDMRLYVNAKLLGTASPAGGSFETLQYGFGLGVNNNRGSAVLNYTGLLDDIRIYNAALSPSDIQRVYRGQQPARVYA